MYGLVNMELVFIEFPPIEIEQIALMTFENKI
jgi:hypothetical protein